MKSLLTAVALMMACGYVTAQKHVSVLIKTDGTKIEFLKETSRKGNVVTLKTDAGQTMVPMHEIAGYYDPVLEEYFHMKVLVDRNQEPKFTYVTQDIPGKIGVYSFSTNSTPGSSGNLGAVGVAGDTYYYFGRGDTLERVNKDNVSRAMEDQSEWRQKLDTIKGREKQLLELIRDYNLASFKKPAGVEQSITIYPIFEKDFGNMILTVNDSLKFPVAYGKLVIFRIPAEHANKVCFSSDGVSGCDLLATSPTRGKTVRLYVTPRKVEFMKARSKDVQAYLMESKRK